MLQEQTHKVAWWCDTECRTHCKAELASGMLPGVIKVFVLKGLDWVVVKCKVVCGLLA